MFVDALNQKNRLEMPDNTKIFFLPESLVGLIKNSAKEPQNLMI